MLHTTDRTLNTRCVHLKNEDLSKVQDCSWQHDPVTEMGKKISLSPQNTCICITPHLSNYRLFLDAIFWWKGWLLVMINCSFVMITLFRYDTIRAQKLQDGEVVLVNYLKSCSAFHDLKTIAGNLFFMSFVLAIFCPVKRRYMT